MKSFSPLVLYAHASLTACWKMATTFVPSAADTKKKGSPCLAGKAKALLVTA